MLPFPGEPWQDVIVDEAVMRIKFEEYMSGLRPWLLVRGWTIPDEPKPDHIEEPGHATGQNPD